MIKKMKNFLVDDDEIDSTSQRLCSMIFLLVAGIMSFFSYTQVGLIWNTHLSFTPGFISAIFSLVLVAPLYIRKILKWNKSIYTIITFILITLVIASFVELAMGGNQKNTLTYALLASSIVLSWLGIRGVAGISWILLLAAAVYSAITNHLALGFYGFLYVVFGFLGLLMHTGLNPGAFMKSVKNEYTSESRRMAPNVRNEVEEAVNFAGKTI